MHWTDWLLIGVMGAAMLGLLLAACWFAENVLAVIWAVMVRGR